MVNMISGQLLSLIAWGVILFFVGISFLIGFFRGMKKSIYFTIIFFVVVLGAWFISKPVAKAAYNGNTLWNMAGSYMPDDHVNTSAVTSFADYAKLYLEVRLDEAATNGETVGEMLINNEKAMIMIDGIAIMVIRIGVLVALLIVLRLLFYILGGIIWLFFLRPPRELKDGTPYKKRRLIGGIVGSVKGLFSGLVILIPFSCLIGVVANVDIATNESASSQNIKMAATEIDTDSIKEIIQICKDFDNGSIGKMYDILSFGAEKGLDDAVTDALLTIELENDNKIVLREETVRLLLLYNAIENTIGIDDVQNMDVSNLLSNPKMVDFVKEATTILSESNIITYALTAANDESMAFIKAKAQEKDTNLGLLFEGLELDGKNSEWWGKQIKYIGTTYEALSLLSVDTNALLNGNYSTAFKNTRKDKYDAFVDQLFSEELPSMLVSGALKYAVTKLPSNFVENPDSINEGFDNDDVALVDEFKYIGRLMNIILDDVGISASSMNLSNLKISTLQKVIDEKVMEKSYLANKIIGSYMEKTLIDMKYNNESLGFIKSDFAGDFNWQTELANLVGILKDTFGANYAIVDLQSLGDSSLKVGQVADLLKDSKLKNSKIACKMFEGIAPKMVNSVFGDGLDFSSVVWKDDFYGLGSTLEILYDRESKISALESFSVENISLGKLDLLVKNNNVWACKSLDIIFDNKVIEYVKNIDLGSGPIGTSEDLDKESIVWRNEFSGILNICLALSNKEGNERYTDSISLLSTGFSGSSVKVTALKAIGDTINEEEGGKYKALLINDVSESILDKYIGTDRSTARIEMRALTNVGNVLDDNEEGYGIINPSVLGSTISNAMPKGKMVNLLDVVEKNIDESRYLRVLMKNNLTISSRPIDPDNNWSSSKWVEEVYCSKLTVNELTENDTDIVEFSTIATTLSTQMPISLLDVLILKEATKENTVIGRSSILQGLVSDALGATVMPTGSGDWSASTWDLEMISIIDVAKKTAEPSAISINVTALMNFNEVSVAMLNSVIDIQEGFEHTNVGNSLVMQHNLKPVIEDFANRVNTESNYHIVDWTATNWDVEITSLVNIFKAYITPFDEEGVKGTLSADTKVKFDDLNIGLATASEGNKKAAAKNKYLIRSVSNNIDSATVMQYVLVPVFDGMKDADYALFKSVASWANFDWIRELDAIADAADVIISESNPDFNHVDIEIYDMSGEEYRNSVEAISSNSPRSYLLQSMLSRTLVAAGVNTYNSAYEEEPFIDQIRLIEITDDENAMNNDWNVMMQVVSEKIDIFVSIGTKASVIDCSNPSVSPYPIENDEGQVIGRIEFNHSTKSVNVIYEIGGEDVAFITELPTTPTHEDRIRRDVEKSLIANAFEKTGNPALLLLKTAIIDEMD